MRKSIRIDESYLAGLLQRLVRTPSVNPFHSDRPASEANEEAVTSLVAEELAASGINSHTEFPAPHRPVLIADVGPGDAPALMLNAHTDTVGIQGLDDPFSGEVRKGRLHGRGAADTKASLAAMTAAVKAVADAGVHLAGKCTFTAVCDEENEGLGTRHIAEHGPRADAAVIGEPTDLALGIGQVGGVKFKIICQGKAAHGNTPDAGVNAILHAARLALRLPGVAKKRSHPLLGHPPFNIGRIAGGVDATTVPASCELVCDRRILPGETLDDIFADIQSLLDRLRAEDDTFNARIEPPYLGPVYGFELSPTEPIVQALHRACTAITGAPPELVVTPFGGDGMYLHQAQIPTLTFGPGDIRDAHFDNESVDLSQVARAADILASLILDFCGTPP